MPVPLLRPNTNADFNTGLQLYQAGLFQDAARKFMAVLEKAPHDTDALQFLELSHQRLAPARKMARPTLVWQFPPGQSWEAEWVHRLLGDVIGKEVVDNTWSAVSDPMIVVDNRLVAEKVPYYRRAFEQGCRVILLHLSDEIFADDYGAYRYCDGVIRNCRSDLLAAYSDIFFFPLGYKTGFARPQLRPKPAAERKHLWSFAGDINKSTRGAMYDAMQRLEGGFVHTTSGFGSSDSLSTDEYRALMDESVVIPCPVGWRALETFRTYEALEAGCIPIIERRSAFDYYTDLLGQHPIPTIMSWDEAVPLITRLKAANGLEPLRLQCWTWWQDYKRRLAGNMGAFVNRILAPRESMSKTHIVIATPCHGGVVCHGYMTSVIRFLEYARKNSIDVGLNLLTHDALITRARSTLVGAFLDQAQATHLLFINSDISFGPEQVVRLLKFDRDVVGATYPVKNIDWNSIPARHVRSGEPLNEAGLRYVGQCCTGDTLKVEDDFATAQYAGTGFLLIKRAVFEKMIAAYPKSKYQRVHNFSGQMVSPDNLYALFDCFIDEPTGEYLSEDYAFCRRWRDTGGEVWLDMRSQLTHTGPYDFRGNAKTFFATGLSDAKS